MAVENENDLVDQGQGEDLNPAGESGDTKVQNTDTGQTNDSAGAESGDGTSGDTPPKGGLEPWVERRFGQLTAEKHSERRAREKAENEAKELREVVARLSGTATGNTDGHTNPPAQPAIRPDDIEALVEKRASEKAALESFNAACNRVADQGAKEFTDFASARDTLNSAYGETIQRRPEFLEAVVTVPDGHKVFYHLGKNPQEAERILNMAPIPMAMEIGRIAATLSKPVDRAISSAPSPIRGVVNGSVRKEATLDDEDIPIEQWMELREKDLERRGYR